MEPPSFVAGVVLAGGRSSRMGGTDKCLSPLAGRPVLTHVVERLRPQVAALAINVNASPERFLDLGLPLIADTIGEHAGPLAGLQAALEWGKGNPTIRHIVTAACDTPFLPLDLVARFLAALDETGGECCVARSATGVHPVIGLWPIAIIGELETALAQGLRKASAWAEQKGAVEVFFPAMQVGGKEVDPFFNINRPGDLAEANRLLSAGQDVTG
jgi:molybdopterin-guanine dinucleotide biosynthesis protein A